MCSCCCFSEGDSKFSAWIRIGFKVWESALKLCPFPSWKQKRDVIWAHQFPWWCTEQYSCWMVPRLYTNCVLLTQESQVLLKHIGWVPAHPSRRPLNKQRPTCSGRAESEKTGGLRPIPNCTFNAFPILTLFFTVFFLGFNISFLRPSHFSEPFAQDKKKKKANWLLRRGKPQKGIHANAGNSSVTQIQGWRRMENIKANVTSTKCWDFPFQNAWLLN